MFLFVFVLFLVLLSSSVYDCSHVLSVSFCVVALSFTWLAGCTGLYNKMFMVDVVVVAAAAIVVVVSVAVMVVVVVVEVVVVARIYIMMLLVVCRLDL